MYIKWNNGGEVGEGIGHGLGGGNEWIVYFQQIKVAMLVGFSKVLIIYI